MIHTKRRYNVAKVKDVEELAEMLTATTWTLCTGFGVEGYFVLNDSFTEDSAQEYAVIKDGRQVESITFSWCSQKQAAQAIRHVLAGNVVDTGPITPRVDHPKGTCPLCS
ncbi:MAG: hypothetical protein IH969_06345 [Candidatus Krumholzibacteriota bacterium]|nr:hypothetical protein [Candidatus Krumholzibacteriota bacterium]